MDLPRIASHTSLCASQLEILHYRQSIANAEAASPHADKPPARKSRLSMSKLLGVTSASNTKPTHLQPPSIQLPDDAHSPNNQNRSRSRTVASDGANPNAPPPPPLEYTMPVIQIIPPSANHLPPSRKREEALAMRNLRKRVQQLRIIKANQELNDEPDKLGDATTSATNTLPSPSDRPQLLQKILEQKPVSMVLDAQDLETAWQDSDFITDCLCWHNVFRQRHGAPSLLMSPDLCHYAQTWANHLAHTDKFYYRYDKNVGQNLFCRPASTSSSRSDVTGQEVVLYWYSAVKHYDFSREPETSHANVNAGHFTQLVWVSSRMFGVGKARSRSGKVIVVAYYSPCGNHYGGFNMNVLPPQPDNASLVYSRGHVRTHSNRSESNNSNHTKHTNQSNSNSPSPNSCPSGNESDTTKSDSKSDSGGRY